MNHECGWWEKKFSFSFEELGSSLLTKEIKTSE